MSGEFWSPSEHAVRLSEDKGLERRRPDSPGPLSTVTYTPSRQLSQLSPSRSISHLVSHGPLACPNLLQMLALTPRENK